MKKTLHPVKENRSYAKGDGACVNVDNTAYNTRVARIRAEQMKATQVQTLQAEVNELKELVRQLLSKGQ